VRALVIDDSRAMRTIVTGILTKAGYAVTDAENGQVGLDRLTSDGPFDVAFVDWNMPVMNGLEFIRAVRAERRNRVLTIVMVTTESETDKMLMALAAGANEYVMKPFTKDILLGKLELLGLLPQEVA
jgi:two-component system, chemotaxis family, chemotaxis protein CheY